MFGLLFLTLAAANEHKTVNLPTAKLLNQELIRDKTSDGPMGRGSLSVFRNDQGLIGGYVARAPIMDSPIHYYDADGKYLGAFHIFGDTTENRKTEVVAVELKKRFPHEDDATWLTPIPKPGETNPLLGKWEYAGCGIKNTRVEGTLDFYDSRTVVFHGKIHRDYSTTAFRSDYRYYLKGATLHVREPRSPEFMPPVSPYFLVQGDQVYFASKPLKNIVDPDNADRKANWTYRIKRQAP